MNSRKNELMENLKTNGASENFINDLLKAKSWQEEKKADFVNWCCEKIQWLSAQPCLDNDGKKALELVKAQHELYLICLTEVED